jgi:FtsH-binding integral membrane protein
MASRFHSRSISVDYAFQQDLVYQRTADERATFMRRTYGHLAGAILSFTLIELVVFKTGIAEDIIGRLFTGGSMGMLLLMGAFIGAGYLAQYWARADMPLGMQYAGLGLYVVVEAVIFMPLLYIATKFSDPTILPTAAILTLALFGGLTAVTFVMGKDLSFLRPMIVIASFVALGLILAAMIFGFTLGLLFSGAMVVLASAAIMYDTSNIMYHYRADQYVGAALNLFASVALLFYYILRILLATQRR